MMFSIDYAEGVADDLAGLRAFDRKQLLDHIDEQPTHQPTQETRNKKTLFGLVPPWEHEEPVWEPRVGEHRVFYVRAIRPKPPHKTTEKIL